MAGLYPGNDRMTSEVTKNVISYTVLGEDGNEYFGNYGSHVLGDSFFMTKEDYADMLVQKNISSESKAYIINRRTR